MPTDPNIIDGLNSVTSPDAVSAQSDATPTASNVTNAAPGAGTAAHDRRSLIRRVLTWLRGGYPNGVPREDYVALFGVLHRELTDAEIAEVVGQLTSANDGNAPITTQQVRDMIAQTVLERPSEQDVARVNAHLAAGGWALAEDPSDR